MFAAWSAPKWLLPALWRPRRHGGDDVDTTHS